MSPSTATISANQNHNSNNYIQHEVSKFDTLAGVAIKYGVEVADIKRLNCLATDLQMFALKTLQIPLPGRHPPSPSLSNGSKSSPLRGNNLEKTPKRQSHSNLLESFQSPKLKSSQWNVSPAMSTLQSYYGLKSSNHKDAAEGTEMAVYRTTSSGYLDDGLLPKASPMSDSNSNLSFRPRNLSNGFLLENGAASEFASLADAGDGEAEKSSEKSVRRRQKAEPDSNFCTPETLLKEENGSGSSGFCAVTGKGLAMRPKSASRSALVTDSDSGWLNSIPVGLGDSIIIDNPVGVRKSSSTSSLQDQDGGNVSSLWSTSKWSLKPDLQAFSTVAITRPIFDGLPKPITGRRGKAALD
ncbi:uncharacterized protein LOC110822448 isoform X1 [Carica papaya]|uniref:uncharacterized protein LOC110822448 isoform X1 n=2 Tax=Carica papaya TaxID=3649 RepID=UPI000B8CC4DF|nr:uncharacterized protein LOC110822448 isoform X1 [Carica papaya]